MKELNELNEKLIEDISYLIASFMGKDHLMDLVLKMDNHKKFTETLCDSLKILIHLKTLG